MKPAKKWLGGAAAVMLLILVAMNVPFKQPVVPEDLVIADADQLAFSSSTLRKSKVTWRTKVCGSVSASSVPARRRWLIRWQATPM